MVDNIICPVCGGTMKEESYTTPEGQTHKQICITCQHEQNKVVIPDVTDFAE